MFIDSEKKYRKEKVRQTNTRFQTNMHIFRFFPGTCFIQILLLIKKEYTYSRSPISRAVGVYGSQHSING